MKRELDRPATTIVMVFLFLLEIVLCSIVYISIDFYMPRLLLPFLSLWVSITLLTLLFGIYIARTRKLHRVNSVAIDEPINTIKQLGEYVTYTTTKNSQNKDFTIEDGYFMFADLSFLPDEIQWFGRDKNSNFVRMDVKVNDEWYTININLDDDTLNQFLKCIPEKLKRSRYMYRPEVRAYVGKKAHITAQNLQGIFEKHEAVELHVTPLWMVVLHNGRVIRQHFIDDIADIRCTKHPTDLDDDMQLLTFEVGEEAFAYALKDKSFVTRLSDATRDGIDSEATRKKKQEDRYS